MWGTGLAARVTWNLIYVFQGGLAQNGCNKIELCMQIDWTLQNGSASGHFEKDAVHGRHILVALWDIQVSVRYITGFSMTATGF